jgi:hypothetical protein
MELALLAVPQIAALEPSVKATALKKLTLAAGLALASAFASAALTYGDTNYVGLINPAHPASASEEVSAINGLIQMLAGAPNQECPGPSTQDCDRTGSTLVPAGGFDTASLDDAGKLDGGATSVNLGTDSFQYILGKYNGPNAGALIWYFADGISGLVELQGFLGQYALSHISWYNLTEGGGDDDEIPEPGSLALLGLGLLAAAGARRKRVR